MKKFEELSELDLLCLIQRASHILWDRTLNVENDDYEPWDIHDTDHFFHSWANDLSESALDWIGDRHRWGAEDKVGEFLIKEQ